MIGTQLAVFGPTAAFFPDCLCLPWMPLQATHFRTTKRAAAQRKELIRQPDGRSYTQQAATMLSVVESARCDASVFSTTTGSMGPVVHNLRDSRRSAPKHQQVCVGVLKMTGCAQLCCTQCHSCTAVLHTRSIQDRAFSSTLLQANSKATQSARDTQHFHVCFCVSHCSMPLQVATCSNASNGNWYFNLALQSSLL